MKSNILSIIVTLLVTGNLHAQLLGTPPETPAERQARLIAESVESSKAAILGELRHNIRLLWDSPDPQAVLDAMQAKAPGSPARLLAISSRLAQFVLNELTIANDTAGLEEVNRMLARIPDVAIDEATGAVTVITPEPSEN